MDGVNQKKKLLLVSIIATLILFVVILIILFILIGLDNKKTKIVYKGVTYKTETIDITTDKGVYQQKIIKYNDGEEKPIILITPENKTYYCIETLTTLTGYKYNKGIYTETEALDESKDKCNIDNGGEYVNFIANTNKISKYIKVTEEYNDELKLVANSKKRKTKTT